MPFSIVKQSTLQSLHRVQQQHRSISLTHLGNSASEGGVSVFLVHVDCFSSGQVSEDDTVVLDDTGVLLVNFLNGEDFTIDLSDFVLSLHVVPEL